jgi:hypothetical protein
MTRLVRCRGDGILASHADCNQHDNPGNERLAERPVGAVDRCGSVAGVPGG